MTEILWETETRGLLSVDGYKVPHITVIKHTAPENDGLLSLSLPNGGGGMDATEDEVKKWAWWIAQAMAVAAGYTTFGKGSIPANPFCRRLIKLDELPPHENH